MDPEVDALYGLAAGEFTAARDALAKRLRADGRRDDAAAVKALRRPTAPAAALNRAVRAHPDALQELLAAARNLRRAQDRLVAGKGDRAVLREASEHVRQAISELSARAGEQEQLSATSLDRVRATLQAALTDDGVRAELEAGRLEREAEPTGLGLSASSAGGPAPRGGEGTEDGKGRGKARAEKGRSEEARRAEEERERAARRKAAQARLRAATERVSAFEERLEAAVRRAEEAAAEADALRGELRAAKSAAAAAQAEVDAEA